MVDSSLEADLPAQTSLSTRYVVRFSCAGRPWAVGSLAVAFARGVLYFVGDEELVLLAKLCSLVRSKQLDSECPLEARFVLRKEDG